MRARTALPLFVLVVAVGAGLAWAAPQATQTPASAPAATAQPPGGPRTKAAVAPAVLASPEGKATGELLAAFVKAFNAADVGALSALFTEDGAVIDSAGDATRGREAIAAMYAQSFEDIPGVTVEPTVESLRLITPDVAVAEGKTRLNTDTGGSGDASTLSRFSALAVRKGGKWFLSELRDYPVATEEVTPYDHLRDLEWMVGDWVDESETSKVSASIRWADNRSFLVRTYSVEIQGEKAMTGTMFIGWDPQNAQIKSWVFDSQGGHGEGLWTRTDDDQWIVKAHGVMRDGRPSSATQIHTIVNKDAVKTASIDRIIGGEIAPDVPEIIMVRTPPPPGSAAPTPGTAPKPAPAAAK